MTGSLISIVSNGASDLYLIGSPQITFFKLAYRRYKSFAIECIEQNFDSSFTLGDNIQLTPKRAGDLIHKSYTKIEIPKLSIKKKDLCLSNIDNIVSKLNIKNTNDYETFTDISKIQYEIYRIISKSKKSLNVKFIDIIRNINTFIQSQINQLQQYQKFITSLIDNNLFHNTGLYLLSRSDIYSLIKNINTDRYFNFASNKTDDPKEINLIMKNVLFDESTQILKNITQIKNILFTNQNNYDHIFSDKLRTRWVDNIGYSIIDKIDVKINGLVIDRHLGFWFDIWYQLTKSNAQKNIHNEMIGNIPSLTNFTFDHPNYQLFIPLTFWFNKFNGLSFPLIALQYNDIIFDIKLRNINQIIQIERIYDCIMIHNGYEDELRLTGPEIDFLIKNNVDIKKIRLADISLDDVNEQLFFNGSMLFDYVVLETPERKLFAQSGHEYLIERIQEEEFSNLSRNKEAVKLDFYNPSKELVWVLQKDIYRSESPYVLNQWNNFTNGLNQNPITSSTLELNGYTRIFKTDQKYFNFYQQHNHHSNTTDNGINMYSFSLFPLQHQPTGSCNFSRLSEIKLILDIDEKSYSYQDNEIYPYDNDINFDLDIDNLDIFIDSIDIVFVNDQIQNNSLNKNIYEEIRKLVIGFESNDELKINNRILIPLNVFRLIPFKNNCQLRTFDLSMNILRLFGGYGSLAFSANN
jgi:hypothetical protein